MLGAAVIAQSAVSITDQGVPTLTAFVKNDLGLTAAVAGLLVAAFPAGKALGSYASGAAVDRIGERFVLAAGAAICGVIVMLASPAPFLGLLVLLIAAGIFGSSATPAGGKLVLVNFSDARRGLAMGIRQTGIPIGGLLAALLLPWLAGGWGWHVGILVAGALSLAGAALAVAMAGVESPAQRRRTAGARRQHPPAGRLRHDRDLLLLIAWACLMVGGQYVVIAFLPVYMHAQQGISRPVAALVFVAIAQIAAIIGRIAWGVMSDRLFRGRRRPLLFVISAVGVACFALLGALPGDAPLVLFGVCAFLAGLSVIGWQGIFITAISEIAGPLRAGAATGFGLTFVSIAITAAPPLYGLIADLAGGFRLMWLAIGAVVLLSFVPAALVGEPALRARQSSRSP